MNSLTNYIETDEIEDIYSSVVNEINSALNYIDRSSIDEEKCLCIQKTRSNHCDSFDYFNKEIPEYNLQNFSMDINEFKVIFWWEWAHRFLGRLIGIYFLLPLIFFTFKEGFKKLVNLYIIFFLICFQGFIGWYMVSSGLVDRVDVSHFRLSIHLITAFLILSLIHI